MRQDAVAKPTTAENVVLAGLVALFFCVCYAALAVRVGAW